MNTDVHVAKFHKEVQEVFAGHLDRHMRLTPKTSSKTPWNAFGTRFWPRHGTNATPNAPITATGITDEGSAASTARWTCGFRVVEGCPWTTGSSSIATSGA